MKIDVSGIDGYAEMTAEEKVTALEALEIDDHAETVAALERYKEATDKATHEAADYKRQLKAVQDAQKSGTSKADETIAGLQARVDALTKERDISKYASQFTAMGYSAELAQATAEAQVEGDTATVMKNHQTFLEGFAKDIKASLLKGTPAPKTGDSKATEMTKEKFKKLSFAERAKFASGHPEEYQKLYGG